MDSTVLLSYRKTTPSEVFLKQSPSVDIDRDGHHRHHAKCQSNGKLTRSQKDAFAAENRQILSSSLSTTYASSTSSAASTTSEEELATARRYSDSNQSSSSGSMAPENDSSSCSNSVQSADCANSNAAFVVDEDDLCNNNALVAQAAAKFESIQLDDDDQQGPSSMIELKPVVEAKKASSPTTSTMPTNCFVSLYVNGKRCLLTIDANCLVYEPELSHSKQNERVTIPLEQILSVWTCHCEQRRFGRWNLKPLFCPCLVSDPLRKSFTVPEVDPTSRTVPTFHVKVFYAVHSETDGLKLEMLALSAHDANNKAGVDARAASEHLLVDMAYKIKDTIEGFDRPKRLLLFINPYGGSKKGAKIFDTEIKPVLELARIDYTVVVTERANHARDMLLDEKTDLRPYDGIVCIGGDGMFGEILNGVLIRTQRQNGVDYGSVECLPVKPNIKLGVIPAGSTDAIVYATSGNKAPINSTLAILLGRQMNIDVTAVHHRDEDKLIQYTASFLGYGFFGDTLADSERNRWLGPRRYDWAGIKKFFKHRLYSGEIKLIIEPSDGSPKHHNPCGINCSICHKAGKKSRQILDADDSPACISIRGRFLAINAATVSCRCGMSKYGMSPMAHVGNGCTDLILISKCSRWDYLRYLYRLAMSKKSPFDFNFVDAYRVREFEFNPIIEPHKRKSYYTEKQSDCDFFDAFSEGLGNDDDDEKETSSTHVAPSARKRRAGGYSLSSSVWNCDGEVINDAAIHVKVHCQLVTLFGAGVEVDKLLSDRPTTVRFQ